MKVKLYIYYLISICFFISCQQEEFGIPEEKFEEEASIYLTVKAPATTLPSAKTRALDESLISEVTILAFEELEGKYKYRYQTMGRNLVETSTLNVFHFEALLSTSKNPLKFYILANTNPHIQGLEVNDTEEIVKSKINQPFTENGLHKNLPMFAELEMPNGLNENSNKNFNITMVRSVARIDIHNEADNFELTSLQLYRANNKIQVIPDTLINYTAQSPKIPANSSASINTNPVAVTDNVSEQQLYLPESERIKESGNLVSEATCVVVGGIYAGTNETTYYRMDFVPENAEELFGQILRNHKYVFTISDVRGSGWRTPDEAANNTSSSIQVTIKEWNENTIHMHFDGENYFGVSRREIVLNFPAGSLKTVDVDTDLSTYKMYWLNDDETLDESIEPITLGQSFTDKDDFYTVSVSSDGSMITAIAKKESVAGESPTKKVIIYANRLRIKLSIRQGYSSDNRVVNVFSIRHERGFLGSNHSAANGDYALGIKRILINKDNFGPTGKVPFDGINLMEDTGVPGDILDPNTLANVDVFYLPDLPVGNTYLGPKSVQVILEWLAEKPHRILYIHHDWSDRNKTMIQALNVTPVYGGNDGQNFTIVDSPFLKGPFGEVAANTPYYRWDGIYVQYNIDGVTPIINHNRGTILGVDFKNRIIYSGDVHLYGLTGNQYALNSTTGEVNNSSSILLANLWAWIVDFVLTTE